MHIIGPMHHDWKRQLEQLDVIIHQNLAQDNYYLISVNTNKIEEIQQLPFVESLVPYYPALKVNPALVTQQVHTAMAATPSITPIEPLMTNEDRSEFTENLTSAKLNARKKTKDIDLKKEGNLELLLFDPTNKEQALASINQVNGVKIVSSDNDRIIIYADLKNVPTFTCDPLRKGSQPA